MIQSLFRKGNIQASDLAKISVCTGPGSFTGLRVGLSLAKGLALPHNIPVVGISGLEIWARMADPQSNKTLMACADVRRGELFWQKWSSGSAVTQPRLTGADELRNKIEPELEIIGSGTQVLGAPASNTFIDPALVAWIGMDVSPASHPADPLYHRPPDAKLPGGRSL